MSGLSIQELSRRYSWWWDSHISPESSKWLKENLTGMDSKMKEMIKLIEEDADSCARSADMYYKRRPELLRLVEDFYRAYRALADRYDHAIEVIRHAHKTTAEAFPDQVESLMMDEQVDVNSPFTPPSVRAFFDPDELPKDAMGIPSLDLPAVKPEFVKSRKGLKQVDCKNDEESKRNIQNGSKHEADILVLKDALAKLEAEKEDGLLQYQKSLERLSNLEKEIMLAQEDSKKLTERASQAEAEVELLKGALVELKAEKELVLFLYQQCLDKISILESHILHTERAARETSDRATNAENEVQLLKQELEELQAEKEAITVQHQQCMETISMIETKLQQAEENARKTTERAEMADSKVDNLNLAIIELTEEKESYSVQCQQYLERISSLEFQILFAQEENQRLNEEINNGKAKLKSAEEHCLSVEFSHQSLQTELDSLMWKMESRNVELTEKHIELGRLWTCVQEERSRFVEAETAFQTLQHLHNESQEELMVLASELHSRAQTVSELELQNQRLQDEVLKMKDQNRTLNDMNMSSEASLRNMQDEIATLRATIAKLEKEIERYVHERKLLLQEIFTLREEFNELKKKHGAFLVQMESLDLDPQSLGSSIKELHDNIAKLSDAYRIEKSEKAALLEKLEDMAKPLEKNAMLEKSIADLKSELTQVKDKVKTLEEACQILEEEKSTVVAEKNVLHSQIQILSEDLGAVTKKNAYLENALADVDAELELLKVKSRSFEESLLLIGIEKTRLLNESESLSLQLKSTKQKPEETEIQYKQLEERCSNLENEKKLLACNVDELRGLLDTTKREHFNSVKFYQTRITCLECQLHLLRKDAQVTKNCYDEEMDKTISAEIENSILRECLQELHGKNSCLRLECLEFSEASGKSEKLITDMEQKNADQQVELEALVDVLEIIGMGFRQIKKTIDNNVVGSSPSCKYENKVITHLQPRFNQILGTLEDIKKALAMAVDENQRLVLEKWILITYLEQLRLDVAEIDSEKCILSQNLNSNAQRLLTLLSEAHILLETNEGLKRTVKEGTKREKALQNNIEELKESYQTLQQNNCLVMEEKKALEMEVLDLKDSKFVLEEEIRDIFLVFKHFFSEKSLEVKQLNESVTQLRCVKDTLKEVIRKLERKLEDVLTDKLCLMKTMESENELKLARSTGNKLNDDISNDKELWLQKEMEISGDNFELEALLNEQTKLQRTIEDLNREYGNMKAIKENQAEQIRKLSEMNRVKPEENEELLGSKHCLETALLEWRKKHENAKTRELNLKSELKRWENKEKLWEAEIFELFSTLQISLVHEACYREKFHDLRKNFENLTSTRSSTYAAVNAQLLKEPIVLSESENAGLRAHFSDYESALKSLSGSAASPERQTVFHEKISKIDTAKDIGSVRDLQDQTRGDNWGDRIGNEFSEPTSFQSGDEAVGLAVSDIKMLALENGLGSSVRAQASELERVGAGQRKTYNSEASSEIFELPKDIMLDQVSPSSSYGLIRREITPANDLMLESWGTTSMNQSEPRAQRLVSHRKESSGIVSEKEMTVVDKLEIFTSPKHPQQKRENVKILERLLFNAQQLANLQKQVQDLKRKVQLAEKNIKTRGVLEYNTAKEQLEEAEETIDKLFGVNHRLTRTVEDDSTSQKSISGNNSDEDVILRKRSVLEQIRLASEQISGLNSEVQKIQFLLLKLQGEKEVTIKKRIIPRVRLRDYLSVFARKQKKKRQFFGCIQPSSSEMHSISQ